VIRPVASADVPVLAPVLARAFGDDPVTAFAHPSPRTRPRRLRFFFTGRLTSLVGDELCWCDEARTGAALWAPPDRWRAPLREELRLLRLANGRWARLLVGLTRIDRAHPSEPHLYLSVLGVDPAAQGRGLGSALLEPGLAMCDREGIGAYLESSKEENLAFYGRHGFRVAGEVRFPGGPPLWLMWRDPRRGR
jgi:ribosomal protein S18 acetylase RimI-like enzyme